MYVFYMYYVSNHYISHTLKIHSRYAWAYIQYYKCDYPFHTVFYDVCFCVLYVVLLMRKRMKNIIFNCVGIIMLGTNENYQNTS